MTPEQLLTARRERWHQAGVGLLTLDDAERWLAETQLCLFLPRRAHLPVSAPSFTEAVAGRNDITPPPESIAAAKTLLSRLIASGAAIPLNLFGAAGELPDFVATPEALPYLYAMQPERNPKQPPTTLGSGRVSQLAVEIWKLLERVGAQTAGELREALGREVTEAAVLRSLAELWQTMRAIPVPDEGDGPATWELLSARHRRELAAGSTESQATALSMLVSFYLQSAIVATGEEVELFLSTVASRSRVRDVLRSLLATRQLGSLAMEAQTLIFVEGSLPEFAEVAAEAAGLEANAPDAQEITGKTSGGPRPEGSGRISRFGGGGKGRPRGDHDSRGAGERRPGFGERPKRPSFGERSRPGWAAKKAGFNARGSESPASDRRAPASDRRERPPRGASMQGTGGGTGEPFRNPSRGERPRGEGREGGAAPGRRPAVAGRSGPNERRAPNAGSRAEGRPPFERKPGAFKGRPPRSGGRPEGEGRARDRESGEKRSFRPGAEFRSGDSRERPSRPPFKGFGARKPFGTGARQAGRKAPVGQAASGGASERPYSTRSPGKGGRPNEQSAKGSPERGPRPYDRDRGQRTNGPGASRAGAGRPSSPRQSREGAPSSFHRPGGFKRAGAPKAPTGPAVGSGRGPGERPVRSYSRPRPDRSVPGEAGAGKPDRGGFKPRRAEQRSFPPRASGDSRLTRGPGGGSGNRPGSKPFGARRSAARPDAGGAGARKPSGPRPGGARSGNAGTPRSGGGFAPPRRKGPRPSPRPDEGAAE